MPNINTTSITPQERFAQTTVSYEKRDIMALPFYEGVEHKARIRGIMIMALLIGIVVGAVAGMLFGLRDPIIDFIKETPLYTAIVGGEDTDNPPADEEMNVSPASFVVEPDYVNRVIINNGRAEKDVVYNGQPQDITWGVADAEVDEMVNVIFYYVVDGQPATSAKQIISNSDWPVNAGKYIITAIVTLDGVATGEEHVVFLTINKATIPSNTIVISDRENNIYNGVEKELSLATALPSDLTSTPRFTIKLKQYKGTESNKIWSGLNTVSAVRDAGEYSITVTIPADKNYNSTTFTTSYTIEKARTPDISNKAFADGSFVYDGTPKSIAIDFSRLPIDYPKNLMNEMANGNVVSYTVTTGSAVNVGKYVMTAIIDSYNYTYRKFEVELEITKADLTQFFDFNDVNTTYNGKAIPKDFAEIVKKQNFPDVLKENIVVVYEYYKGTSISPSNKISVSDIIDAGTYTVVAKFAVGNNYVKPEDMKMTITVGKADLDLKNIKVKKITDTYTGMRFSFTDKDITGLPEGVRANFKDAYAVDAGSHEVKIYLSGNNYKDAEITGKIVIDKAAFDYIDVTAKQVQSIPKDGKLHLPVYTGQVPEGAWVDYFIGAKKIEGVDRMGTYDVKIVVADKNHEHIIPVKFTVSFNPLTILMGIIIAIPIAAVIAVIVWWTYRISEKRSAVHFYKVTRLLNRARGGARGGIICQGSCAIFDIHDEYEIRDFPWIVRPRLGRLYLTHSTLEFYDINYIQNYKNMVVQLRDISGIEIRGILRGKLIVFTTNGRHEFFVEPNTAFLWRRDIVHFRNLAHHHPVENYMVDNNYPFKYEVYNDGDWPPETRADVKKIKNAQNPNIK